MRISLIINTYNRADALAKVLAGVSSQTRLPDEIIFADDGSEGATTALITQWRPPSRVIPRHVWQPHEGFRRTVILNQAVRAATTDYLVFLDGDCIPDRRFIEDHVSVAERGAWVQGRRCFVKERFAERFDPNSNFLLAWLCMGRISGAMKSIRLPLPYCKRDQGQRGILGCNMGMWRQDLFEVNGFDEHFVGWGGEDSDLGSRLYHLGRVRKFVRFHAVVYHLNHPPQPRDRYATNHARLSETIRTRKIRCEYGLAQLG